MIEDIAYEKKSEPGQRESFDEQVPVYISHSQPFVSFSEFCEILQVVILQVIFSNSRQTTLLTSLVGRPQFDQHGTFFEPLETSFGAGSFA